MNDIKYYLALSHFKKGDWKTAKEQIEEFIASLPPSHEFLSEAHYILGLSEFNLRQYGKALKIFQKIAKSYSEQTSILKNSEINIAKCLYKLGNIKESLKKFNEIIDRYPQTQITQESLLWLGDHYLQSSDFENAATYYLQFIENFPGSDKLPSAYFQLGQAYQGQSRYNDAVNILKKIDDTTDPTLYAKARLAIAEIFSKEFDQESAIQTYEKILSTSPEFSRDALVKIADVHKKEDDHLKAIEAYQKALASDKGRSRIKNAELQFAIGDTFELLNKKDRAVETYFKIPYLYAKETAWIVKAYLRIARIFEDQEKWEKARTIYKKIIDLRTDERKFAEERLDWIRDNIIEIK